MKIQINTPKKAKEEIEIGFSAWKIFSSSFDTICKLYDYEILQFCVTKPGICKKDSTNKNCTENGCKVREDKFRDDSPFSISYALLQEAWKDELASKRIHKLFFKG